MLESHAYKRNPVEGELWLQSHHDGLTNAIKTPGTQTQTQLLLETLCAPVYLLFYSLCHIIHLLNVFLCVRACVCVVSSQRL